MRVHVVNVTARHDRTMAGQTLDRFADLARQVEAKGFAGLWVTEFVRARPADARSDRADERHRRA